MRMDSQRLTYRCVVCASFLVVCLTGFVSPERAFCQSAANNSNSRAVPAPWRPAFGPVNNDSPSASNTVQPKVTELRPATNASLPAGNNPATPQSQQQNAGTNPITASNSEPATTQTKQPLSTGQASSVPPVGRDPGITQVTRRLDKLPNSAGQVWREYDITPYTSRVNNSENPQQAILDWILRETGNEMWFNEPLGILHANRSQLYVYHTPEIHRVVKSIVDRFVRTRGQLQRIDVNLVTIENPNWRAQSYTMLQPIEVRSPGVEAWMISKENAALLQGQLGRRIDFKQHSSGMLTNNDGQTFRLDKTRPVQFVRNLRWVPNQIPNYQPLMTNINEGYSLAISSLTSLDNNTIEAIIKCEVDQVEKLTNVRVNLPGADGKLQQMNLQIPQLVSWRLHERFRWPNDQVLLLSCGVVATPEPEMSGGGFRLPILNANPKRADALLFIEYRGPATGASVPQTVNSGMTPIRQQR